MIAWTHAFASMPREAKRLLRRRADVEVKRFGSAAPFESTPNFVSRTTFCSSTDEILPSAAADAVGEFFLRDWA